MASNEKREVLVFRSFQDHDLIRMWRAFEESYTPFPQLSLDWCSTWWQYHSIGRELAVFLVVSDGRVLCVCPMCNEAKLCFSQIRPIPVDFGDIFSLSVLPGSSYSDVLSDLLSKIKSSYPASLLRFDRVYSNDVLASQLQNRGFLHRKVSGNIQVQFRYKSWDEYFLNLKRKFRQETRRRMKRLNEAYTPAEYLFTNEEEILGVFDELQTVHRNRWLNDYKASRTEAELKCWREVICKTARKGQIILYLMRINNKIAAYRLGFIYNNVYYDWHVGYNMEFRSSHIGIVHLAYVMKNVFEAGYSGVNFMVGEYDWKQAWSPEGTVTQVCLFTEPSRTIGHFMQNTYSYAIRPTIRKLYHIMMRKKRLRWISRRLR